MCKKGKGGRGGKGYTIEEIAETEKHHGGARELAFSCTEGMGKALCRGKVVFRRAEE